MMHLKAIGIKEELLGPDNYEVGLSIGHLASLSNFHMNRYRDAEKLYRRSIAISKYIYILIKSILTRNAIALQKFHIDRLEVIWRRL